MWESSNIHEDNQLRSTVCSFLYPPNLKPGIQWKAQNTDGSWIFAMCDGQGENTMSKLYCEILPVMISNCEEFSKGNLSASVQNGFIRTSTEMKEKHNMEVRSFFEARNDESAGLSVSCLVLREDELILANAGLSRCIMLRHGQIEVLSGSELQNVQGADSCSMDASFNTAMVPGASSLNNVGEPESHIIFSSPDLKKICLSQDVDIILLGSEGLWTWLSDETILSVVVKNIKQENGIKFTCDELFSRCLEVAEEQAAEGEHPEINFFMMIVELKKSTSSRSEVGEMSGPVFKKLIPMVPRFIEEELEAAIKENNLESQYVICRRMDRESMARKLSEVTVSADPANPRFNFIPNRDAEYNDELQQLCMLRARHYKSRRNSKIAKKVFLVVEAYKELAEHQGILNIRTFKYLHPMLFPSMEDVEEAIKMACLMVGCSRSSFMFYASSTGYISGQILLVVNDAVEGIYEHDCEFGLAGHTIPMEAEDVCDVIVKPNGRKIQCIIIVEKHTVFVNLKKAGIHKKIGCVLLTGSGQSSEATRVLVPKLAYKLSVPVYCLVDCNPYGLEIYCTYRFGSNIHSNDNLGLTARTARLLGLHPSYVVSNIPAVCHVTLDDGDRLYLEGMLSRPYVAKDEVLKGFATNMLLTGLKAQIEHLCMDGVSICNAILVYVLDRIQELEDHSFETPALQRTTVGEDPMELDWSE